MAMGPGVDSAMAMDIQNVPVRHPLPSLHYLFLYQGNHSVATSEGERSNFEKGQKQGPHRPWLFIHHFTVPTSHFLSIMTHLGANINCRNARLKSATFTFSLLARRSLAMLEEVSFRRNMLRFYRSCLPVCNLPPFLIRLPLPGAFPGGKARADWEAAPSGEI